MDQLKTFYILIEHCCNHFNGVYAESELQELAADWFGKDFKFDTVEELDLAFYKEGYGLSKYTI